MAVVEAPSPRDSTPEEHPVLEATRRIPAGLFDWISIEDERATPEPAPPGTDWIAFVDPSGFADIVREIGELASGDESDEYGVLRPSDYAYRTTMQLLKRSFSLLSTGKSRLEAQQCRRFPRGAVSTDEQGGLRIEWVEGDRAVHLVVPAEPGGQSYIYHEIGQDYAAEKRVSGSALASWLARLSG